MYTIKNIKIDVPHEKSIAVDCTHRVLKLFSGVNRILESMRPKARWLAQLSGPPGWLEENDPAGMILSTGRTACLFHTVLVALTGAAKLPADGISRCCYIVYVPEAHIMYFIRRC